MPNEIIFGVLIVLFVLIVVTCTGSKEKFTQEFNQLPSDIRRSIMSFQNRITSHLRIINNTSTSNQNSRNKIEAEKRYLRNTINQFFSTIMSYQRDLRIRVLDNVPDNFKQLVGIHMIETMKRM